MVVSVDDNKMKYSILFISIKMILKLTMITETHINLITNKLYKR